MSGLSFRERILAGIIASGLAIAILGPCEPRKVSRISIVVDQSREGGK
jgi:hypothetical protein